MFGTVNGNKCSNCCVVITVLLGSLAVFDFESSNLLISMSHTSGQAQAKFHIL